MRWFVIIFKAFDAVIKLIKPDVALITTVDELGYQEHHILVHGFTALVPTLLFIFPRTSVLGPLLVTAHLGGAIASQQGGL